MVRESGKAETSRIMRLDLYYLLFGANVIIWNMKWICKNIINIFIQIFISLIMNVMFTTLH